MKEKQFREELEYQQFMLKMVDRFLDMHDKYYEAITSMHSSKNMVVAVFEKYGSLENWKAMQYYGLYQHHKSDVSGSDYVDECLHTHDKFMYVIYDEKRYAQNGMPRRQRRYKIAEFLYSNCIIQKILMSPVRALSIE